MVYFMDNSVEMDDDWGTPILGNLHMRVRKCHIHIRNISEARCVFLGAWTYDPCFHGSTIQLKTRQHDPDKEKHIRDSLNANFSDDIG